MKGQSFKKLFKNYTNDCLDFEKAQHRNDELDTKIMKP